MACVISKIGGEKMTSILGLCFVIVVIVCWLVAYRTSLWFYVMLVGHEYDFSLRLTALAMKVQKDKGAKFDKGKMEIFNSFCRYSIVFLEGILALILCNVAKAIVVAEVGSLSAAYAIGLCLAEWVIFSAVAVGFYKIARFEGRARFIVGWSGPKRYFIELQIVQGLSVHMSEASESTPICYRREL